MSRTLSVNEQEIALDPEGYLECLADWSPDVASALAAEQGIKLELAHWEVIDMLRRFHAEYEISPAMRILVKLAARELGSDKGSSLYLLRLFPGSPAKIAALISGLPRPTNCL